MKNAMDEMRGFMRRTNHVDDLVHRSDSPFIASITNLPSKFINNFVGGQRHKRSSSSLLNIKQGENESLHSFISHFNREALLVEEMDEKILLVAFHNEVTLDLFIHKLYDREP